ncbi:hypothetical protein H4R33_002332 [Dimargaris cristalligena]|nr:hypothetical protein H4R33_002332 [Dimargaris cristalligena]
MRVNCIAIIGKQTDDDLKYHYIAHTSCDVIEEKLAAGSKNLDMYLGLLQTVGDLAV